MSVGRDRLFSAESIHDSGVATLQGEVVEVTAGPMTDLFIDPGTGRIQRTATMVSAMVDDQAFQFSARVRVPMLTTFDAGVLLVESDDEHWAKLCLEQMPSGEPCAVSVVNRGLSDDANGWIFPQSDAWLRISRDGHTFAFHTSTDGTTWDMLRHFALPADGPVKLSLLSQSPTGTGMVASFSDIKYVAEALGDVRSGK